MDSTPAQLKPYLEAEKLRQQRKDAEMWQAGIYTTAATYTAVAMALMGKKSKAKYFEKPLLEEVVKEKAINTVTSEDEKKKQRNALLASLQLMQANFELNHEKGGQDK